MKLKSKSMVENIYLNNLDGDSYIIDSKDKKKSKTHTKNNTMIKENLNFQMLNSHEFISNSIDNREDSIFNPFLKESIDTPLLELTTEKNNIDTENINIVSISNEITETPEIKRSFSFKSNTMLDSSILNVNKIENLRKNSLNKSGNAMKSSQSGSRLFFEESKVRSELAKTNYDNIRRAPANDYDNIFSACRRGDLSAVIYFVENCKVNNLSKAVLTEKEIINKRESESVIYINGIKKCIEGYTVLQNAIFGENMEVIKYLLSRPSLNIDQKSGDKPSRSNGTTALHTASIHDNVKILSLLLQCGADPTIVDCDGHDVVALAIRNGNISIVQFLETQLTIHYQNSNYINLSVIDGYIVMLNFLIKRGCPTNYVDPSTGKSALHIAAERGFYEICKLLVNQDRGLIYQKDFNGKTPLEIASANCNKKKDFRNEYWENISKFLTKVKKNNVKDINTLWHLTWKRYIFLFCAPLLLMGLWFLITFSIPYLGIVISSAICYYLHSRIYNVFIANSNTANPYVMMFSFVAILYNLFMTCLLIIPYSEQNIILNIVDVFIMVTVLILFLYCVNSNPGYLTKEYSMENSKYKNLSSLVYNGGEIKKYCYTCELMKPKSSKVKHCKICNKCVCRFDHHCTFINNCVGAGNHKTFIYLLISALSALGMTLFRIVETCIKFYNNNGFIDYSKLFSKSWIFYSSAFLLFILDLSILILLSMLSYQQFNQIAKGVTYNDIIKSAKEKLMKGENSSFDDQETQNIGRIIQKSTIDLRQNSNDFYASTNDLYKFKNTTKSNKKVHIKNKKYAVFFSNIKIFGIKHLSKYKSFNAISNIARFMFKRKIFDDLYKVKKNDMSNEV